MNFTSLLASDFTTSVLPILRYVLFFLIVASAIIIIITTLLQANNSSGGDPITGGIQESYYAKNKGGTRDGKLKIVTIVFAAIIAVCTIVYFVTELFNKTPN